MFQGFDAQYKYCVALSLPAFAKGEPKILEKNIAVAGVKDIYAYPHTTGVKGPPNPPTKNSLLTHAWVRRAHHEAPM